MGSSTVSAQKIANAGNVEQTGMTNQANKEMTEATNDVNYKIAQEANDLEYKMFNEQNQWNLEQWERENEYNSPSAQMQRYIEAGINPLFAVGNITGGNASQLTSAQYGGAHTADMESPTFGAAHIEPEYDKYLGDKISGLTAIANNASNSAQGFYQLALEEQDVATRRSAQQSKSAMENAETMYKKAQTAGQEIYNNLNTQTYGAQVSSKVAEYDRLRSEIDNIKEDTSYKRSLESNLSATKDQIVAQTNYVNVQASNLIESIKQRWAEIALGNRQADISQQNADTNAYAAVSDSYYKGEHLKLSGKEYKLQVDDMVNKYNHMSNREIIDYVNSHKGWLERLVGRYPQVNLGFAGDVDSNGVLRVDVKKFNSVFSDL